MKPNRLISTKTRPTSDRGEVTRQRLLEVAIRVFAARGFDGARTRDIAEAAKTNIVSIAYYFGNKQGLYHAAALHVAARWAAHEKPLVQQARTSMARPGITHRELVGILCTLLCDFVRLILGNFLPDCYGKFLSQAASGPAREFSVIDRGSCAVAGHIGRSHRRAYRRIRSLVCHSSAGPVHYRVLCLLPPRPPRRAARAEMEADRREGAQGDRKGH